jgi:hypothetical protein
MKSPSQHTSQTVNQPSTWWTLCCWVGTGATHWGRKTRHADWRSRPTRTWSEDAGIRGILLMLPPYFSSTSECQISPEDELIVMYLLYHNDDIYGQVIFIKVITYQDDVIIYTWSSSLHCWWSELASSIITFRIQPHNKCFIWAEVIYAHCGPSVMSSNEFFNGTKLNCCISIRSSKWLCNDALNDYDRIHLDIYYFSFKGQSSTLITHQFLLQS